jgi:hypothetical protein
MPPQPLLDLGMFMGGVIVGDNMDVEISWALLIDQSEEGETYLMTSLPRRMAVSLTFGALPASTASFQRSAQRHQQSPGLSPGQPNSGTGGQIVAGGLRESQKGRIDLGAHRVHPEILGSSVAAAVPIKPVIGLVQHSASGSPRILRGSNMVGCPRSFELGRNAIGALGKTRLDRVPDLRCNLDAVEPCDLLDAGR